MTESLQFLTTEDRRLLDERATRRFHQPGDRVLSEGERREAIFLIRRGVARVERDHLGYGVPFARLEAGEIFGEMSFVDQSPVSASVVADTEMTIDVIEGMH